MFIHKDKTHKFRRIVTEYKCLEHLKIQSHLFTKPKKHDFCDLFKEK